MPATESTAEACLAPVTGQPRKTLTIGIGATRHLPVPGVVIRCGGKRAGKNLGILPIVCAALTLLAIALVQSTSAIGAGAAIASPGTTGAQPEPVDAHDPADDAFSRYSRGDIAGAQKRYLLRAEAGDRLAAFNAAAIRLRGEATEPDEATALLLLRRSAEAGFATAQYILGTLYEQGHLVPADQIAALEWYERAADQGLVDAQVAAATQHFLGRGTRQDYARALKRYRQAADGGDGAAAYIAGSMYEHGDGTGVDLRAALAWYSVSARQGDEVARLKAREIADRIASQDQ